MYWAQLLWKAIKIYTTYVLYRDVVGHVSSSYHKKMSKNIEILTDLRVKDLLPILLKIPGVTSSGEIDSVNYGEGFDLTYKNLDLRLYDDLRSYEVMGDIDFQIGELSWDEAFQRIALTNKGHACLTIEIDRYEKETKEIQSEIRLKILDILKENGFEALVVN